jgi:hypothetical protein
MRARRGLTEPYFMDLIDGWAAWDRFDEVEDVPDDRSEVLEATPMYSVVRYAFDGGIGFELIYGSLLDEDDLEAIRATWFPDARLATAGEHGWLEDGSPAFRVRTWQPY